MAKPAKKMVTVSYEVVIAAPRSAAVAGMAGRLMSMVIAVMVIMAAISAMKAARPGRDRSRQSQAHAPSGKRATTRNGATRWICTNRASWSIGMGAARWEARAACRMALTSSRSGRSSGPVRVM